jgi:hypothetical protein
VGSDALVAVTQGAGEPKIRLQAFASNVHTLSGGDVGYSDIFCGSYSRGSSPLNRGELGL